MVATLLGPAFGIDHAFELVCPIASDLIDTEYFVVFS